MTADPDLPFLLPEVPPVLVTPRLRLRPLREDDAGEIFSYAQDPAVARYVLWEAHTSLEDSRAFLRQVAAGLIPLTWGVVRRDEDRLIGTLGLARWDPAAWSAEVGFALGRRDWGQGFASEALGAVVEALFRMGLHRLEARVFPENHASARVLFKLGFREEGLLREAAFATGAWQDLRVFGRINGEGSAP